jgi:hypothetical protein
LSPGLFVVPLPSRMEEPGLRRPVGCIICLAIAALTCGCAALPDFERMQCTMDQMAYYMGAMTAQMPVMAHSTKRIADNTEHLQHRADGMMADLQKEKKTAERAIQNYTQATLDNDRAVIQNLMGIRKELGEIKDTVRKDPKGPSGDKEHARISAELQARLREIETRLDALAPKQPNGKPAAQ